MKILIQFVCLLYAVNAILGLCNGIESGSIIPLYIYPIKNDGGNAWQQLYDAYKAYPIETWAIVNVNSGPGGKTKDSNYATSISNLHAAGINTLAYVSTNYTRRSQTQVKADIDRWKQLYKPKGIFFDEMAYDDSNTKVQYYQNLNTYAKSQGFAKTVANPGTRTLSKYFPTVDNIVIFETDTGFPSKDLLCSQDTNGKGRGSVSILPYNIKTLNTSAVTEVKDCVGYVFVTDDSGDNPWDTLPNYLTKLFQTLKG